MPAKNQNINLSNFNCDNTNDVADRFNDYFVNVCKEVSSKIPDAPFRPYDYNINASFFCKPINEHEIITEIKKLNKFKSCGVDKISSNILKQDLSIFVAVLRKLFNKCRQQSTFPNALKRRL